MNFVSLKEKELVGVAAAASRHRHQRCCHYIKHARELQNKTKKQTNKKQKKTRKSRRNLATRPRKITVLWIAGRVTPDWRVF